MEENKLKRIKYRSRDERLEDSDGDILALLHACKLCLLDEEFDCQENLDELAMMFPQMNEFQFMLFCKLLMRALFNEFPTMTGAELMKVQTREEFSEEKKRDSLRKLYYFGILDCTEPSQDIAKDELSLDDYILYRLRNCGPKPFEMQTSCPIGNLIFPDDIKEETLFYNPDTLQSLEDIKEYLQPANYKKLEEHFEKESGHLCFATLLEGPSGTGKTAFVKEIARCTGRPILFVDVAKIRGEHWGEDEKGMRKVFNEYLYYYCPIMPVKPILFVDECDTLLARRQNPDGDINSSLVNGINTTVEVWLQELDTFDGILFLTTNNANHMDEAIARRLLFQVHIGHPDEENQIKLWRHFFPTMSKSEAREMAKTTNFTGGQIKRVKDKVRLKEILHGPVKFEELKRYCGTNGKIQRRAAVGFCKK